MSAISTSPRQYGLEIVRVLAGDGQRSDASPTEPETETAGYRLVNSGRFDGMTRMSRQGGSSPTWRSRGAGKRWSSTGCTTGASPASGTGARRFRSSTVTRCGPVPVPEQDLPVRAARDRGLPSRRLRRLAARAPRGVVLRPVPHMRQAGTARDRRLGHLPRLGLVLPAVSEHRVRRPAVRLRRAPGPGARSRCTSAATSTRCCTCCTPASSRWC